jgi:hypothetical protein
MLELSWIQGLFEEAHSCVTNLLKEVLLNNFKDAIFTTRMAGHPNESLRASLPRILLRIHFLGISVSSVLRAKFLHSNLCWILDAFLSRTGWMRIKYIRHKDRYNTNLVSVLFPVQMGRY